MPLLRDTDTEERHGSGREVEPEGLEYTTTSHGEGEAVRTDNKAGWVAGTKKLGMGGHGKEMVLQASTQLYVHTTHHEGTEGVCMLKVGMAHTEVGIQCMQVECRVRRGVMPMPWW